MLNIPRPAPFVLISSNHGTMIVNRNDYHTNGQNSGYGVGYQLFNTSSFDQPEVNFALALLDQRRMHFGEGVVALDCGANIGVHTIEWARLMCNWGEVIAFEAQEKIYYALAGNIIINNCLNVTAKHCAVGAQCSTIEIPEPNYLIPSSYGSFELRKSSNNEFIGQKIDYKKTKSIPLVSIDSLELSRLDFIKIDVEGMEVDVLKGAARSIEKHKPIISIEVIKSDKVVIEAFLVQHNYKLFPAGINIIAVHHEDPTINSIKIES
jgi:FkbM family methyltransferase